MPKGRGFQEISLMKCRSIQQPTTLRRSVALPSALIGELNSVAPPELRTNLNRLVILSLQEYVTRHRRLELDSAIAAMAEDPQVQAECARLPYNNVNRLPYTNPPPYKNFLPYKFNRLRIAAAGG
jgi:hypothetical protein